MPVSAVWAALFIQSASPGAVFRFLERRRRAETQSGNDASAGADILFLSDALSGNNWRAMPGEYAYLNAQGAALSRAFPPVIFLLYRDGDRWGAIFWEAGTETERQENVALPAATNSWKRFFGAAQKESPPAAWARERQLPLFRVPGALPSAKAAPLIEYRTIAGLDQRNLLVETGPRLYRFVMGQ